MVNTIQTMAPNSSLFLTNIAITGTTAASWQPLYLVDTDISGAVLLVPGANQTISGNYTLQAYNLTATNQMIIGGERQLHQNPMLDN